MRWMRMCYWASVFIERPLLLKFYSLVLRENTINGTVIPEKNSVSITAIQTLILMKTWFNPCLDFGLGVGLLLPSRTAPL